MSGLEVREGRHAARRPEARASRSPFARLWSPTARLVEALVLLLALNLWATPADGAAAQGPAPVAPVPAQLLGSPCPPGSTQQSLVVWGCYPCSTNPGAPNCGTCTTCPNQTELDDLDWGFGTAPDEIICVDKFDPGLGTLTSVQVEAFMDFEGKVCIYNSGTECCEQPYDFTAIATLNVDEYAGSDLLNSPIVWDVFANDNQSLPGTSIKLAPSNGAPDCGLMMGDPTLANTSCVNDTGARDTRVFEWSVLDQAAARQLIDPSLNPADQVILDNWVAASAGERAKLSTVADGQVQLLSNCPVTVNYAENPILRGRKRLKVTYTYCTNAAPTCVPPATPYEVDENSTPSSNNSVVINLLDLVTDVDGCIDCSTFQITQQPGFAAPLAASCTGLGDLVNPDPACTSCTNCVVTYTPTPGVGFCGEDFFKFLVQDDFGASVECEVFVTVNPVNAPPVCNPPAAPLPAVEDGSIVIDFCQYLSDPDEATGCGLGIDCDSIGTPTSDCGGTFTPLGAGQYRFRPPMDFCGQCTITFSGADLGGLPSGDCQLVVDVAPVNDPPICNTPGGPPQIIFEDEPQVFDLSQWVLDPDAGTGCGAGDLDCSTLTFSTSSPELIAVAGPGPCEVTLSGLPDQCGGPYTLFFNIADTAGAPIAQDCQVRFRIGARNDPPTCVANPPLLQVQEDTPVTFNICDWVEDIDESTNCGNIIDPSSLVLQGSSCGGTLENLGGCQVRFTPPADFCGPCSIDFTISDVGGLSVSCTVDFVVDPVNDPPVCVTGPALAPIPEGGSVDIDFTQYVEDPDEGSTCGAGLDVSSISPSSDCGGTFTPQGGGVFTFTPTPGTCGTCTLSVTASDLAGLTVAAPCPIPLEVLPVNDPPVCVAGPALPPIPEGGSIIIDFKQYVSDPDDGTGCGDGLDVSSITPSTDCDAVFVPLANGRFRFRPALGTCGPCTITFTAADLGGLQVAAPCPIPVTIDPVNEAPECVAGPVVPSIPEGGSVDIDLTQYVVDPDDLTGCGDGLDVGSFSASTDCGGTVTDLGGGLIRFTPAAGFCGPCTISFTVNDLGGLPVGAPCPIPLEVLGQNTPPVAADDTATTNEDTPVVIDVIANDFDADDGGTEGCGCTLDSSTIQITSFDPDCVQSEPAVFFDPGLGRFAVRLVPAPDYCGPCVFTYEVSDSDGRGVPCSTSNQATVTVTIDPVNDPPIAEDDFAVTQVDTPVLIDLCLNDSDPDAETGCGCLLDCSTIEILDSPSACGTLELDPGGTGLWLYTPAPDFEGECCFTYRVFDSDGGVPCDSATAQVCIEVNRFCPPTNLRNPASLLLYPEFDNRPGMLTIHTVTNSDDEYEIDVHFEFVGAETCERSNRSEKLTPNDTFTFATSAWIAEQVRGYSYVYASCDAAGNEPVVFNHLTGGVLVMDGFDGIAYSMNAIAFRGIGVTREGVTAGVGSCEWPRTDLNGNGHRDLDAMEYDPVPDEILIPRFLGQTAERQSELILIALTGGKKFDTQLDFLIYNDNEQVFSRQYEFYCWERTPLEQISALFRNEFLAGQTDNNPLEVLGNPTVESGWIRIDGGVATSTSTSIEDPAFYAILVEKHAPTQMAADLPFGSDCPNLNGRLLPGTLTGE